MPVLARRQRSLPDLFFHVSVAAALLVCSFGAIFAGATTPEPIARYSDQASGFALEAPVGWRLVRDGEVALPPVAKAAFRGPRSAELVYAAVEFIPGGLIPQNDDALATYFASYAKSPWNAVVRTEPESAQLAGRRALRGSVTLPTAQGSLVKTLTVARDGYYYFALVSIAADGDEERQAGVQREFESRVTISKTSDEVVDSSARRLSGLAPYLSSRDLRSVVCALLDRATSLDAIDYAYAGLSMMSRGRARLSDADARKADALVKKVLDSMSPEMFNLIVRVKDEAAAGRFVSIKDDSRAIEAVRVAFSSLTSAELVTARRIALECIRLDLEAYDDQLLSKHMDQRGEQGRFPGGVPGGVPGGIPGERQEVVSLGRAPLIPVSPLRTGPSLQRVSGGVLAGKAIRKPQPDYPKMAGAAGIEGKVVVEVIVNEAGVVQAARAVSGHPLLRDAAVIAARGWTFQPTVHQGKRIKVVGTMTFDLRKPTPPTN